MDIKTIEIRDRGTFIPALALRVKSRCEAERYLMSRVGFQDAQPGIILMRLNDQEAHSDVYDWKSDTMKGAHHWLEGHFDEVENGGLICMEFIRGERTEPKVSERLL